VQPNPMSSATPHAVAFKPGMGLATKLILAVALAWSLIFVGLGIFSVTFHQREREMQQAALNQRTQSLAQSLQQVDESGRRAAQQSFGVLLDRLPMSLFQSVELDGKHQLQHAGYPLASNFEAVDAYSSLTGGVATVFQREGDDFRRITTSLKKEDGSRAINTLLDRNHPAYRLVLDGKGYVGRAVLFGKTYMTLYEPVLVGGKLEGILFIGLDMGQQLDMMNKSFDLAGGPTLTTLAVDLRSGQTYGRAPGKLPDGDPLLQALRDAVKSGQGHGTVTDLSLPQALTGTGPTNIAWSHFAPWGWAIVQAQRDSDTTASARSELMLLWSIIAGGALAAAAGVFVAIRRMVLVPLRTVLADVELLRDNNYSQALVPRSRDELGQFIALLEQVRRQLSANMRQMEQSARDIDAVASEVAKGNTELGGRTESAAGSLQQTTTSLGQLTTTVRQSADAAAQANQLATSAAAVAARGGEAVHKVVATMDDINQSSRKIADIIGVIDSIAFQTNILALNAAVEAARAGEAGRGFAVVASEVRNLAGRSAQAAKEIKDLINASVDKVQSGTQQVQDAGNTMGEIVVSVQRVTDVIAEITSAARDQSDGIGQVNAAVGQLDQMTQQNAAMVEEVAAAADSLTRQTMRLQQALAQFKTGNDGVPDSAIEKRDTARTPVRPAPLALKAPVKKPAQTAALPPPSRHADAQAPRLGSSQAPGASAKSGVNKSFSASAGGQKSTKNTTPLQRPVPSTRSSAPAPARSQPAAVKAPPALDSNWESF